MNYGEFDSGAIAVTDASNWVQVYTLTADGKPASVQVSVGAGGAIAHFKISQAAVRGGTHKDLAVDADFAAASSAIPLVIPPDGSTPAYQCAANGTFQLNLAAGAVEFIFWAKKATTNTTVQVNGIVRQ